MVCGNPSSANHIYISDSSVELQVSPEQDEPVRSGLRPARINIFCWGVMVSRMGYINLIGTQYTNSKKCSVCKSFQIVVKIQYVAVAVKFFLYVVV